MIALLQVSFAGEVAQLIQERDGLAATCAIAQDAAFDMQQQNRYIASATHALWPTEAVAVSSQGHQVATCQRLCSACHGHSCDTYETSGLTLLCALVSFLAVWNSPSLQSEQQRYAECDPASKCLWLHPHVLICKICQKRLQPNVQRLP